MPPEDEGTETETNGEDETNSLAELQRAYAAERGKGATAGKRELLRELGFTTKEEAVAWVTTQRASSADASELQRQVQEATAARVAAEAKAHQLSLSFEASRALVEAGVRPERVTASLQLVMASLGEHPEAPDAEVVRAAVATFKEGMPELFGTPQTSDGDPKLKPAIPGTSGLNGGTAPAGAGANTDPRARADAQFEARFAKQLARS